ncbi:hypothetical protein [Paremcibacter congregatus]|uniref:hypothetical protein n=1 Tax=Paremcibacter congregatus TaxID=2043170 RepID=UPI003A8D2EFA
MKLNLIVLSVLFFSIQIFNSISQETTCKISLKGFINEAMLTKIKNIDCSNPHVLLSSSGGEERISLLIAQELEKLSATISVDNVCLSACAEVILPAARKVKLGPKSLIGFHGNPIMRKELTLIYKPSGYQNCTFSEAEDMSSLYERQGVKTDFWKSQLKYLHLTGVSFSNPTTSNCPYGQFKMKYQMWLPNSQELKKYLGLNFDGSVCADHKDCRNKVNKMKIFKSYTFS